jgi:hypothetical protein
MAGHCFCRFRGLNTAGSIVAQIFGGLLLLEPESAGLDAATKQSDAIFLRGARRSKIKGFLLKRGPSEREERDGNGEAGTEWKDA